MKHTIITFMPPTVSDETVQVTALAYPEITKYMDVTESMTPPEYPVSEWVSDSDPYCSMGYSMVQKEHIPSKEFLEYLRNIGLVDKWVDTVTDPKVKYTHTMAAIEGMLCGLFCGTILFVVGICLGYWL